MNRGRLTAALVVALLAAASGPARAYTRSTVSSSQATGIAWDLANDTTYLATVDDGAVLYRLHAAGSADVSAGSAQAAVERAFRTWSGVAASSLRFRREPDTANATTLNDDEFTVFWSETGTLLDQGTAATEDDVSIAGALAVAFVYREDSGPETGEIIDANIVFNGADFAWTVTPAIHSTRYDIESVALHEIGHTLGLDHSPVAAASLFPRIGSGRDSGRRLAADDVAGLTAIYPGGNTAAGRGTITGTVSNGVPLLGAQVWARDPQGRVLANAVTDAAGVYTMAGLSPGPVTLHTQPVNAAGSFSLYSVSNMGPYYASTSRDFSYSGGLAGEVLAGDQVTADLTPPPGPPALEVKLISRAGSWSNVGISLRRGETSLLVGVAGPGLPTTGTPLKVSGQDVTVEATVFGTVAGLPSIEVRVSVAADAALGARDLVVTGAGGITVALGAITLRHAQDPDLPPEVTNLSALMLAPGLDLTWEPSPGAAWYRLYRGDLGALRAGNFPHQVVQDACYLSVPGAALMDEAESPGMRYFLVTALGAGEQEGTPGTDSEGMPRPAGSGSCP